MDKYKICPVCLSKNDPTVLECLHCEADLTQVRITDEKIEQILEDNTEKQLIMNKYKICPACLSKNDPTILECLHCEADLTQVRITDEKAEQILEDNTEKPHILSEKPTITRRCDCGEKNPANARKCQACGEDISDIGPTPDSLPTIGSSNLPTCILKSIDGAYTFKMCTDQVIIGREHEMSSYLASKHYVSRSHAKLTREEGLFYIENLSTTNFTFINNKKILSKTKLCHCNELGLGGTCINGKYQPEAAYFVVEFEGCI